MSGNISLTEKKQIALIQNGNHDEILNFIWAHPSFRFTPTASQVFIERGNSEEILAYIAVRPLPERGEIALIKRGVHHEILAYTKGHKLYEAAEKALIKRGVRDEILAYLDSNSFSSGAVIEFIHSGDLEEIEKAAARTSFGYLGEQELISFGVHRHIMAYIKIRRFCNENSFKALLKRGNEQEIELYKSLYGAK